MIHPLLLAAIPELGTAELAGPGSNPRIVGYTATAGGAAPDDVPWCSSFVNWCAKQAGLAMSGSKAARSWLHVGTPLLEPEQGCVCVFWRGDHDDKMHGHVAIFLYRVGPVLVCLGGNQGNIVGVNGYMVSHLLGMRRL